MKVRVLIPCVLGDPGRVFEPMYPGNVETWIARGMVEVVKEPVQVETATVEHQVERAVIERQTKPRKIFK